MKIDLFVFRSNDPDIAPEGEYLVEVRPDGTATLAWRPDRWSTWGRPLKEVDE